MSFKIFKPRWRRGTRAEEMKRMFEALDRSNNLVARVDMNPTNVYPYAKKFGYKVTVSKDENGSIVRLHRQ